MTFGNYIYQDGTAESRKAAIDQLISTSDKLEAGHLKAVETASQLQNAIAQLDMNEAEDGFKQKLLGDLQTVIDDNTKYDNMYYALDDIVKMGGKIMSDPRVLGKLRAQKAYKAYHEALDKRTDINEDKKDWMRDLNKYYYEDKVDENGKIIGGTEWKPTKTIGKDFDYGSLLIKAIHQVAAKQIRSGEVIEYLDKYGNPVDISTNPNGVASAWIKKEDGLYKEKLDKKDIQNALDTLIATTPGALTGLQEDYDFARWYHKKHKDEEGYSDPYGITVNSIILSPEDYKKRRFNQGVDAASYLNIKATTDQEIINPNLLNRSSIKANAGAGSSDESIISGGISSIGVPTQYKINVDSDTKKTMDNSINAVKKITSDLKLPGYIFDNNNPEESFSNAIQGVMMLSQTDDESNKQKYLNAITAIKIAQEDYSLALSNNKAIRNSEIIGLTGKDAKKYDDAMSFITDFNTGKLTETNQYYKEFSNKFNELYTDKDGKQIKQRVFTLTPERIQKIKKWAEDNNVDLNDYNININGTKITIQNNIQSALTFGKIIYDITPFAAQGLYKESINEAQYYQGNGARLPSTTNIISKEFDTGNEFYKLGSISHDAINFADKQNKKANKEGIEVRSQSYLLPNNDFTNVEEGIPVTEAKALYDDTKKRILNLGLELSQFTVYSFDKDDEEQHGNLVKYNSTDARDLRNSFIKAQLQNQLQISPMIHNVEGVGAYLQFPEYKDGKETGKYITCFVKNAIQSDASRRWENHPDVKATQSVGKILDMPGQSDYAIRESSMPNLGEILMTGDKNDVVKIIYKGKTYNTDMISARKLKSFGIQLEDYKNKLINGKIAEDKLPNLLQFLQKASVTISDITGDTPTLIYEKILKDYGL